MCIGFLRQFLHLTLSPLKKLIDHYCILHHPKSWILGNFTNSKQFIYIFKQFRSWSEGVYRNPLSWVGTVSKENIDSLQQTTRLKELRMFMIISYNWCSPFILSVKEIHYKWNNAELFKKALIGAFFNGTTLVFDAYNPVWFQIMLIYRCISFFQSEDTMKMAHLLFRRRCFILHVFKTHQRWFWPFILFFLILS